VVLHAHVTLGPRLLAQIGDGPSPELNSNIDHPLISSLFDNAISLTTDL